MVGRGIIHVLPFVVCLWDKGSRNIFDVGQEKEKKKYCCFVVVIARPLTPTLPKQ